jgi:hypothetical protein
MPTVRAVAGAHQRLLQRGGEDRVLADEHFALQELEEVTAREHARRTVAMALHLLQQVREPPGG